MAPPPGILEVRCAGCGETLEVEHGLTEFACPDCGMAQALPPEHMPPRPRRALPLPGRGGVVPSAVPAAAPWRVSCGGCGAILSVPHGPGRFSCPLCGAEIAPPPLAAVVSVVAPPAAIPITSSRPAKPSEVLYGNSNQPTLAGQVQKSIISEHTHGQHHKHSFREESFSSFRVDSRTQIPDVGRLQNKRVNPSSDQEESCMEPPNGAIARPGKKKSISAAGPKYCPAGKLQEEHINKVIQASMAQGMPSNSEGPDDMITVHNKQKTGHMVVPSVIEHEQINPLHQVCDEQQAGENSSDLVHVDQVQVACKAIQNNKRSTRYTKGNQKRQGKSPLNHSTELPHLRRSKRIAKGQPDPIDIEPIHRIYASPNQNQSETPQIESTIDDTDPISPNQHRYPHSISNKLDNVDATTPVLNHTMPTKEIIPQCYSQMYSPESRWALPNPSSNSWHEHEMPNESFDGIVQLDSSDDEVHSTPLENHNQDMDGQLAEEACAGKSYLEQDSKNLAENGRQKNGFVGSSGDAKHHRDLPSGMGTSHQINLAASCNRLAALLPVSAATPLPTISSPSFEKLPVNCSSPTTPHHQRAPLYSQDAWNGDILSVSDGKSSKKRRGRAPAVLMEPRKEADKPVLTPNGTENWIVHPPCSKVTTTLSLLIKQNYPGTYVLVDTNGTDQPFELVVYHWHQCPSDIRDTILDEFLKRYKWSPGQEEECRKIFDRKALRQLVNLFCYEKQRVRELIAKKAKRSSAVVWASRSLEEGDDKEDSEEQHGDESVLALEHEDPLKWKPFVPEWMQPKWWEMLCDHWAKDEVMKVSYQKRKNRNAGNDPCHTSGLRSIAMHQRLTSTNDGRKLVPDIDPSTKINSDKGGIIDKKALRTEGTTNEHTAEARDAQRGPHPVQEQMGGCKRGRYYCDFGVRKKVQTDSLSIASPGCSSNPGQPPMFTHEQVQQMINQALQGLHETWEKKFLSLEQNMRSMSKSRVNSNGPKGSLVAVAGDKQCQLARQDTLDSMDGEKDPAGGGEDDPENQDYEDEHWS
ncbi:hypothetical protein E2562_033827 [Oryza meyeriana var. granulata]|uniref:Uncharacterized protein n=1 Tax=Oryza meyeriana var. granulata TaxID=110450 RepID=A0A6G1F171_9ORYZ|nr:hypothetical protein E2562_033827 [Oryza meyeriana var. granulata]